MIGQGAAQPWDDTAAEELRLEGGALREVAEGSGELAKRNEGNKLKKNSIWKTSAVT